MGPPSAHRETLPAELVYDIVIDIFAQYLQQAITHLPSPQWNAFVVLPSVSRLFYSLSQHIFRRIFGEDASAIIDLAVRRERFATSKALWRRARLDPCPEWDPVVENFNPDDIPRPYKPLPPSSILALYDTISRGRYFFNSKASHVEDEDTQCSLRLWFPYMAQALRMSNEIYPRRLLQSVGAHIVKETTHCHIQLVENVAGVKNALDHLLNASQFHLVDLEICSQSCIHQNISSLKALEMNKWQFMWLEGSYIADAFSMSIIPSRKVLIDTKILESLPPVSAYNWKEDPHTIKERTEELIKVYTNRIAEYDS
ncbi:hypothetical protein BU17DRAFT_66335 [Hysterangium stoloniferum]|nr:hypothetical protein BU17DRAFT_66335 [Hysterangium stoloniferum]